jgi:hypothetical protein
MDETLVVLKYFVLFLGERILFQGDNKVVFWQGRRLE